MKYHSTSSETVLEGRFVDKLSLTDSSLPGMLSKLGVAWIGFVAGIGLSDVFTIASIIYVCLNIYVLIRDKLFIRRAVKHAEKASSGE